MQDYTSLLLTVLILIFSLSRIFGKPTKKRSSNLPPMDSAEIKQFVQKSINDNAVFVAAKSFCPHCRATKELLFKILKLKEGSDGVVVIELDEMDEGSEIQNELQRVSGQRTVPNIFIKGKHIGGNSDLQALYKSGKLESLLKDAGVL